MDCSVELWSAKTKNQKEDYPVIRRCRKNCIGDLGAEQANGDPKQSDSKVKSRAESDANKQRSWWNCPRKTKSPSVLSLSKTASVNCCTCCCVVAAYLKEVCRFLLQCPVDSKVSELFAEVLKVSGCVCNDCYNILKSVFRILFVIKK